MKNILVFIDWYWPGYKAGGTVRAFMNIVSYLKDDFVFHIITRNTDYTENKPYTSVRTDEWNEIEENVFVYYASAENVSYRSWKQLILEKHYDAVYIHGIFSFWFSIVPLFLAKRTIKGKILVAAHGMLGDHAFQVKSLKKNIFLHLIRWSGLYKGIEFHAANLEEAEDIKKRAGTNVIVRIAHELPKKEKLDTVPSKTKVPGELRLVWIARIAAEKNLKFALEVLSGLSQGSVSYDLFGPIYDQGYWDECQNLIKSLPSNIKVQWKGSIPGDEVTDTLKNYHCLFLPTTGENFGHAILESMMAGCPVVISDRTPWRDLERKGCGFDISLDYPSEFIRKIELLTGADQDQYDTLSANTLNYIKTYIDDPEALKENLSLFKN